MMRSSFLPFSRPSISTSDIDRVVEVLNSGWITTGPKAREFEERFASYVGAQHAVAVSSATSGLQVLLASLDLQPGDEIITPSLTWVSTVNMIVLAGAKPVFVDVDRDTLMPSPKSISAAITDRTRMIIPVHYAGAAAEIGPIRELARRHEILLVEDAAHAIGTAYLGERIGARGTAIFSFHAIKNLTTGEGGMICSDDSALIERVKRLKFHGLGVDTFDRHTQGRSPQAEVLEPGFKCNLPDILAALGLSQLERIEEINAKRRALAQIYLEELQGLEEIIALSEPPYRFTHSWHLFVARLDTDRAGMDRTRFMDELKALNIGTGIHFRAVHSQKFYSEVYRGQRLTLPNTDWNSERILSLPLFPDMTEGDVLDVVEAIRSVLCSKVAT